MKMKVRAYNSQFVATRNINKTSTAAIDQATRWLKQQDKEIDKFNGNLWPRTFTLGRREFGSLNAAIGWLYDWMVV